MQVDAEILIHRFMLHLLELLKSTFALVSVKKLAAKYIYVFFFARLVFFRTCMCSFVLHFP